MKRLLVIFIILILFGCAKLSVETTKPIKVDISMRVDVYQHVVKDVESIEDQIYGNKEKQLNFIFGSSIVYAQDSSNVDAAIQRRKDRASEIEGYFAKGYIGENKDALLEDISGSIPADIRARIKSLITQENKDREILHQSTAKKNSVNVSEVRKIFFQNHYKRAPSGWWFQVYDEQSASFKWIKK